MASRVLICGTSGIGRAIALRLHARSIPVYLLSRDPSKLAAEIGGAPFTAVDASQPEAFEAAVRAAASSSPLRGLVYAIGSIPLKPLKATTAADFIDAFTLNTLGAALALKAAAPSLSSASLPRPGAAVLFSSVAVAQGFPNHAAIAAAKGAVEALTRAAAAELAPRVRVNCIAPSLTDTPLAARLLSSEAMRKALGEAHPIPRLGSPDDVAAVAELLLELDCFVNGQVIAVDGGRSTLRPKN